MAHGVFQWFLTLAAGQKIGRYARSGVKATALTSARSLTALIRIFTDAAVLEGGPGIGPGPLLQRVLFRNFAFATQGVTNFGRVYVYLPQCVTMLGRQYVCPPRGVNIFGRRRLGNLLAATGFRD